MLDVEAAWMAGFLDGEGSVMIWRSTRHGYTSWVPAVSATSTTLALVERCRELVGGKLSRGQRAEGNGRTFYVWQLTGPRVEGLLAEVTPYMVTKLEQAQIALALRSEIRPGALPGNNGVLTDTSAQARREDYRLAVRALNHRGSTPVPGERLEALARVRVRLGQEL